METKKRSGSERVQPDSKCYLAIERARQGAFSSHPKGMALPALMTKPHRHQTVLGFVIVEALDRAFRPALHTSPSAASGRSHVTALAGSRVGP